MLNYQHLTGYICKNNKHISNFYFPVKVYLLLLYDDFIVNIYNWIGNKFLQLTNPSPYKYINNITSKCEGSFREGYDTSDKLSRLTRKKGSFGFIRACPYRSGFFGVFRVKNHDFTPKSHIFPILRGGRRVPPPPRIRPCLKHFAIYKRY